MWTYDILLLSVFSVLAASAQTYLKIAAPRKMEALSGSCLHIPCNFTAREQLDKTAPIRGIWIIKDADFKKYPQNVVYNTSNIKYPMNFTGNLVEGNCETLFSNLVTNYTDQYFFRIETKEFKATAIVDQLQITVKDSLSPEVNVSGGTKENDTIKITCSAATPCPQRPPTLTWSLQSLPQNISEQNKDRTFTSKIQQTIILSDKHDGLTISCSASYPVKEGQVKISVRNLTLSVSYAPKDTTALVSPSSPVSAGTFVNLSCSSRANPPVSSFTWFWISTGRPVNVSVGALYSVNVAEGAEYYCEARNQIGAGNSKRIKLIVQERSEGLVLWWIILGVISGIIVFGFIGVCFWRLKSASKMSPLFESERAEDTTVAGTNEVQYGQIDFSKRRAGPTTKSQAGGEEQSETVYAEVNQRKSSKD